MNALASDYRQAAGRYIDGLAARQGEWLITQRRLAADRVAELGFPDSRQEQWRYTSVEGLLKQGFVSTEEGDPDPHLDQQIVGLTLQEPVAGRLVFVDGLLRPELSDCDVSGMRICNLRSAMVAGDRTVLMALGSVSGVGRHAFAALNMATMQDGAVISIAAGSVVEQPIELLHIATGAAAGRSLRPRHLILLDDGAEVSVVERFMSLDQGSYFVNLVCEIIVGEGARLNHQRVQQESLQAFHLSELFIELKGNAHYRGIHASLGGGWSRTTINSRFAAPGGNCELEGLYLAGDGQLADFHIDVGHAVPGCDSRENFKGILSGRGRAVFDGRILVERQAQKSNAHLSNANLMLSRRCEIDTKPQLEILADDVQCSHGTTVGQLDPQALFYLRSRGLDMSQARRLLCLGFANEILESFDSAALREALGDLIRRRIESADPQAV